tara:strand:+ start:10223 stop:10735 length:513 start_codon:yes stop_codon:yes gene_type:complete
MSAIKNLPDNYNLLSPVSFKFQINKTPMLNYFCQGASIPGLTLGETARVTPFVDYAMPGDKVTFDDLTISFLVDEDLANYTEIVNWIKNLGNTEDPKTQYNTLTDNDDKVSDCTLTLLTNNMNANKNIIFLDCWPSSLSELTLETMADSIEPLSASATFKYRDFNIKAVT